MAEIKPTAEDVKIASLSSQHARVVAQLHISGIKTGFISSFTIEPLVDYAIVEAAARSIELQSYIAP